MTNTSKLDEAFELAEWLQREQYPTRETDLSNLEFYLHEKAGYYDTDGFYSLKISLNTRGFAISIQDLGANTLDLLIQIQRLSITKSTAHM